MHLYKINKTTQVDLEKIEFIEILEFDSIRLQVGGSVFEIT